MSTRVNESILNDEIREHQKENRIDHMKYLPGMEVLDSDIPDQVITAMDAYDYDRYTDADVKAALSHEVCTVEDFKALLSPAALPHYDRIWKA